MSKVKINTILLAIIAAVAVGSVLRVTDQIFLPLVIAVLLSFAFSPVVAFMARHRMPRIISILSVLTLFLTVGFLIGFVLYSSIRSLTREFPIYQARVIAIIESVIERYNLSETLLDDLIPITGMRSLVLSVSGNFLSFVSGLVLVLIFLLFIMLEQQYVQPKLIAALNKETTDKLNDVVRNINAQIGRYIGIKLLVSMLTAVSVFISFSIIGVDFPVIWATLTFLFNFIPSIGSFAISLLASLFAFVQFSPQWGLVVATVLSISLTELIVGNFIEPSMLGERLNISPVLLIISLLIWGWIWGIAGMFLSVPLTVAIKITLESIPATKPIGILMGGRPPRSRYKGQPNRGTNGG